MPGRRSGGGEQRPSLCRLPSPINPPTFRWRELIEPWAPGVWRVRSVGTSTRVERVLGSTRVDVRWGHRRGRRQCREFGRLSERRRLITCAVPRPAAGAAPSRFGVARRNAFKTVVLRGVWSFDALSVDGHTPFRTESIGKGRYWVLSVVATGRTGDPIVTKSITPTSGEVDEGPMWVLRYT